MANRATIPRGTDFVFRADIADADGTETMSLVVAPANPTSYDAAGSLVLALAWDSSTPGAANAAGTFYVAVTAAQTQAFAVGNYFACVWRTDSGSMQVPIVPGQFAITDNPRAA